MVTWRIVNRTIREMPKDARIPLAEAYSAIEGDVLKKMTATKIVSSQPMTAISVPDCFRNTIPIKMTIMGNIARKKRMIEFNRLTTPVLISYTIT